MKTKAAVFYEPNKLLRIEELEIDDPKTGELRVKMKAVGLCRSDHNVMVGTRPVGMTPMVLGHEGAGVVDAVGPGVTRIKPGDHVVLMFIPTCGRCHNCVSGKTYACDLSANIAKGPQLDGTFRLHNRKGQSVGQFCLVGAFSEYAIVNQDSVCVVGQDYPFNSACLVGCGVTGGFNAAVSRAKVTPGSSVLVIGTGGIGMNVVQGAKAAGASIIIAADLVDHKLKSAKIFGATHTINAQNDNVVETVMKITNGKGVDFAFEAISHPDSIAQAYDATARLGTAVIIGLTPSNFDTLPISPLNLVLTQKTLMGTLYGGGNALVEIPKLLRMYKQGQLRLDELVTTTYTLDQINQGYEDMIAGKNIRGVVVFD
ncbi:MAG: Zn-dependent alcohol dehydrogenase [Chloroflexi bacterium]|nr:Zn-dependent alcohol dehydrogenase [Chloroflexota bacterium]